MKLNTKLTTLLTALAAFVAITLVPLTFTGCATPGSTSTNSVWSDPAFVSKTALFLKATVANGTAVAISEQPSSLPYFQLARATLATVRGGSDYSPTALEKAISALPVDQLKGTTAKLVTANLCLAYELYWSQMVSDGVSNDLVAASLIDAAIAGLDLGLQGQTLAVPANPQLSRPAAKLSHKK